MLQSLELKNVGPAPFLTVNFEKGLNIITGDNGLGKTFIMDLAWWSLTRTWPKEINPKLLSGEMARPLRNDKATINVKIKGKSNKSPETLYTFNKREQTWKNSKGGRPVNSGLILYAMSDGSFSIWDPLRNYWKNNRKDLAYVYTAKEVWKGDTRLDDEESAPFRGLIDDWDYWRTHEPALWEKFTSILKKISPPSEPITTCENIQVYPRDSRGVPAILMPYGEKIPLIFISAAMRRIISLAYCLVWAWETHQKEAQFYDDSPSSQIVFLIDEIESHLHPKWQRVIIPSIMSIVKELNTNADVQVIITTHSPLIMTSCEDIAELDEINWLDIDLVNPSNTDDCKSSISLQKRDFEPIGNVEAWLQSEAFNLTQFGTRSIECEQLLNRAEILVQSPNSTYDEVISMTKELISKFSESDPYLKRWQFVWAHKNNWII